MRISQSNYLYFYDHIIEEINNLKDKHGFPTPLYFSQEQKYREEHCWSAVTTGPSFKSSNSSYDYAEVPKDDIISLKDLEFGDFIDKHYKDVFISHCKNTTSFDYDYFKQLSKKIAICLYNIWLIDNVGKKKR